MALFPFYDTVWIVKQVFGKMWDTRMRVLLHVSSVCDRPKDTFSLSWCSSFSSWLWLRCKELLCGPLGSVPAPDFARPPPATQPAHFFNEVPVLFFRKFKCVFSTQSKSLPCRYFFLLYILFLINTVIQNGISIGWESPGLKILLFCF